MRAIDTVMRAIDVIRKAKDIYVSGRVSWMCESFEWAIGSDWNLYLKNNIPLFCYNVAVQKFGATGHPDNYWWDKWDRDERIRYFDWLFDKYRDPVGVEYYPVI